MMKLVFSTLLSVVFMAIACRAGTITKTRQSNYLYTPPDSSAPGGIRGKIKEGSQLLRDVFAITPDNPKQVYQGSVSDDGLDFQFKGLPVAKYDLLFVCHKRFYEGFKLTLDEDSLTDADRKNIETAIMKSVPFFNEKKIHRCQGKTGVNGTARCVLQVARTKPITLQSGATHTDIQVRSLRLALVEDVGSAGWQLVFTREIIRMEVGLKETQGILPHVYLPTIGQIRVMDTVKDLGEIELPRNESDKQ